MRACICATCMSSAQRDQKRALDPTGLDLQIMLGCHVGPGIEPRTPYMQSMCSTTELHPLASQSCGRSVYEKTMMQVEFLQHYRVFLRPLCMIMNLYNIFLDAFWLPL